MARERTGVQLFQRTQMRDRFLERFRASPERTAAGAAEMSAWAMSSWHVIIVSVVDVANRNLPDQRFFKSEPSTMRW
jgi:hypothetical protein